MKILLDTADLQAIENVLNYFPVEGFTTNPSILAKESSDLKNTLSGLKRLAEGRLMIHVQVTAAETNGIVEQARQLRDYFGDNFYAKIPLTLQGLRAVPLCKKEGIHCTITAIFTPMQAMIAGKVGADYVAPYVDRLDNITSNGVNVVREIVDLFKVHNIKTEVLAASFKNIQQLYDVAAMGAHAATINADLCPTSSMRS